MFLFFEGGKRRRKTGRQEEKGRKTGRKGKEAVRRERTKRQDPLIQITNTLSKDIMINIIFIYYNI